MTAFNAGDISEDATVDIPFSTNDSAGAAVTATVVVGDVRIYMDAGLGQKTTTNGLTLTKDFDGVTGCHMLSIDTSNDTGDVGFWAAGSNYTVLLNTITVDSQTVSVWKGAFSIDNTTALRPTTAGNTLDVTATGAAGIDWANVENPTTAVDLSGTDIQLCDTVTTYTGNTVQTGDAFARLGAPAGASVSADVAVITAESTATAVVVDGIASGTTMLSTDMDDLIATSTAIVAESTATAAVVDGIAAGTTMLSTDADDLIATSTATNAAVGALNDISVADIFTTQMTESYAANGVAPTSAQSQFAMHQMLMQFGISGTSLTVRKLDDATTAFVVTLDSATSPTDAKRV